MDRRKRLPDKRYQYAILTDKSAILTDSDAVFTDADAIFTDADAILTQKRNLAQGLRENEQKRLKELKERSNEYDIRQIYNQSTGDRTRGGEPGTTVRTTVNRTGTPAESHHDQGKRRFGIHFPKNRSKCQPGGYARYSRDKPPATSAGRAALSLQRHKQYSSKSR